jgi:rhodanese-related sulfurtransferase
MPLPTIPPEQAKRLAAQGATMIDIRDPSEYARERIAGARNVPLPALTKLEGLSAPIIFHCRAGERTANNAEKLKQAASCEAYIVAGGIEAWKRAGLNVVVDRNQPIDINRQVMIAAGSIVLLAVLLGYFLAPQFYALAGLIGAGLVFAGISGWCGLAKLLGLMPWNRRPLGA